MSVHHPMAARNARTPSTSSPHRPSRRASLRATQKNPPTPMDSSPRPSCSVGQSHPPRAPSRRRPHIRPPSPNYFGLIIDDDGQITDYSGPAKDNWSPAGSSIRSFAAAIPKTVPLEPNRDFEAFKRQIDRTRGSSYALPTTSHVPSSSLRMARPRPARWHSHSHADADADAAREQPSFQLSLDRFRASLSDPGPDKKSDSDQSSFHDSAYVSLDSNRSSNVSLIPSHLPMPPRVLSPLVDNSESRSCRQPAVDDQSRQDRFSLDDSSQPRHSSPSFGNLPRAATLPMKLDMGQNRLISAHQLVNIMDTVDADSVLILDVRSVQNFSQSRIKNALNLCIPTTLLKRATFGIQKLQQTFQDSIINSAKFDRWRDMQWIIIYDTNASDNRDAVTAQNMMKKFTAANYTGNIAILRGGFSHFRQSFSGYVDDEPTQQPPTRSENATSDANAIAPVIGGVMLPSSTHESNPFFSNIRQNIDLADGVGQFDVHLPQGLDHHSLPAWLRETCAPDDHGKKISDKFLKIERQEQSRMKGVYAAFNPRNSQAADNVQLCGVEKGVKNRYKDILPFEHSRVRLQNKPPGCCDYINASHLSAYGSNKRYIATQGPLPATFEDFWSVIWDQDVRVIVMLTATTEGGQLKCHPYWEDREFGPLKLRPLSEKKASLDLDKYRSDIKIPPSTQSPERGRRRANTTMTLEAVPAFSPAEETPHVIIRKFALTHTSHPFAPMREITHLHFPGWPDFGTPAKPSHLLALVELANVMQRATLPVETGALAESHRAIGGLLAWHDEPETDVNPRPMLVHCSAGCGRTGAFCTVDSVVDMLKRKRKADLAGGTAVKDSEGDVQMTTLDGGVSPETGPDSYFQLDTASKSDAIAYLPHQRQKDRKSLDTDYLDNDSIDLIEKTVQDFRQQRLSTVQSLRQYVLCYESVAEWIHCIKDKTATKTAGRKRGGSLTLTLPQ